MFFFLINMQKLFFVSLNFFLLLFCLLKPKFKFIFTGSVFIISLLSLLLMVLFSKGCLFRLFFLLFSFWPIISLFNDDFILSNFELPLPSFFKDILSISFLVLISLFLLSSVSLLVSPRI